jgi:xanthine dehydrogenase YagR molybdenum-binding subunit
MSDNSGNATTNMVNSNNATKTASSDNAAKTANSDNTAKTIADDKATKTISPQEVVVGKGINRLDGRLKVTGKAQYSAEFPLKNVACAVLLQSTISKGTISSIDTSEAERQPGVIKIITYVNAPRVETSKKMAVENVLDLLQDNVIHYNRQNIGVVVGETFEAARDAAALVKFSYASETPVLDFHDNLGNSVPAPPGFHKNDSKRGDPDKGFAEAAVKIQNTYSTPMENHNPMEPHATTAVWNGDKLTIYDATQSVFNCQGKIAHIFGIPTENVRVISYFVGGGFGGKGSVWSHVPLAVLAARMVSRPVKVALARAHMYGPVGYRPATLQHVKLGADKDGRLTSISHEGIIQSANIDSFCEYVALPARYLYSCPNVQTSHKLVRLDVGKPTFMRAPGESTGTYALESAMDELACSLNIDPIELRLKNYADKDEDADLPYSSKSLKQCYQVGAKHFGWSARKMQPRSMTDGKYLIGWGMASATYPVHRMPSSAKATILADGTALVQAGSQDIGTGTYTVMTQIAADNLALPVPKVQFQSGDTNLPRTPVSGGSTTVSSTGAAILLACQDAIGKLAAVAVADKNSPLFGASIDKIQPAEGRLTLKDQSAKADAYEDILSRNRLKSMEGKANSDPTAGSKEYSMHSFGAHFAEVRVDPEIGTIRVNRWVAAFGAGKIINAKTARSQMYGGIIYGIGMALTEETMLDTELGRVMNADLAEYHVPVHADIPEIDINFVDETDYHINPVGAKGVGEIGITGVAAAIANAVYHATGVRVRDLPITLDKILV